MAKKKQPAPKKGGKNKVAPKKVAKKFVAKKLAKPSPVTDNPIFKGAQLDPAFVERALHPTVEEQYEAECERKPGLRGTLTVSHDDPYLRAKCDASGTRYVVDPSIAKPPSLLRRAWNGVKRAFNFRSSKTGRYVKPEYAEANPDTTVRERVD